MSEPDSAPPAPPPPPPSREVPDGFDLGHFTHDIATPLAIATGTIHFLRGEIERLLESEQLLRALTVEPRRGGDLLDKDLERARGHLESSACDPNDVREAMEDADASYKRIEELVKSLRTLIKGQ